jgi:hypothetical protein
MYVMNCTRSDIVYLVNRLSIFTRNPSINHCEAIKKIIKYLRYTVNYVLHYNSYLAILKRYNDANWISDTWDSKSTNGYVFTLNGTVMSWKSSKQTCIARSMMESEFIAFDKAREETEWI